MDGEWESLRGLGEQEVIDEIGLSYESMGDHGLELHWDQDSSSEECHGQIASVSPGDFQHR